MNRAAAILMLCLALLPAAARGQSGELSLQVRWQDKQQVIHGFGASDAWSTQFVGDSWPRAKRERMADLLFSTEAGRDGNPEGIGLSIWRFNIGAGSARQGRRSGIGDPWRRAESFLAADSSFDWNKQAGQQWFMQAARDRGVRQFVGFVNSPPVLLTRNGKAFGDGSGRANIAKENYNAFAEYLVTIARHFKQKGMPFTALSPVNEPQWDWSRENGQEGSPYQNAEITGVIRALDGALQQSGLDTRIEVPETAHIKYLHAADLPGRDEQMDYFFGPESKHAGLPHLARGVAAHSYFTTWPVESMVRQRQRIGRRIAESEDLEYWMTEYCILADNPEISGPGRDLGMDPALYVARLIHFDLTLAHASTWQWWLAVSPYDYKDGLIYIDKNRRDGQLYESKILWVLGNYSRFVRPGARRLGIRRSDDAGPVESARQLMVSAYGNEEEQTLAVVLVNYGEERQPVSVKLEGSGDLAISTLTPYVTSGRYDLEKMQPVPAGSPVEVPPRSVVTLQARMRK